MRPDVLLLVVLAIRATEGSVSSLNSNGDCDTGFVVCAPPGATSATTPQIGDAAFPNLFTNIVQSSLPSFKRSHSHRAVVSLCCNALLSCLTVTALGLPICYDKFTTNFFLPDGSYGTIVGGSYTSSSGDHANLETGDFTLTNGQTGNIYSNDPAAKPNTATLPMPSQFTASGVGSAVPISSLGSQITLTYTTTLPGSVVPAVTISPTTISGVVSQETILVPNTVLTFVSGTYVTDTDPVTSLSAVMEPASTILGTTLPASTANAIVTVVTTTQVNAIQGSSTPSASTTKSGAGRSTKAEIGLLSLVLLANLILI